MFCLNLKEERNIDIIKYIVIGALIWQLILTLSFIVIKENEEIAFGLAGGIPLWLIVGICRLVRFIYKKSRYFGIRSILENKKSGEWVWCNPKEINILQETGNYDFPRWTDELRKQYPQNLWPKYFIRNTCGFNTGNFRYAPKTVWKQFKRWEKATEEDKPTCYEPNDNPYPFCKGANTPQGLAENDCYRCCLYEDMIEDWE